MTARSKDAGDGAALFGRERELELLRSFVERVGVDGDALLFTGHPGVGKTILLDAAASLAVRHRVVRASGAEFEVDLSFAALHQILFPLLDALDKLRPLHRQALDAALGLEHASAPDRMVVSNAALALLALAAAETPVLLIVDDLQWLDRASAAVLAFVVRRLSGTRVGFLGAMRSGEGLPFEPTAIAIREVPPLDDVSANALLADRFPALAPRVRQRLLTAAQGNPLALLELPVVLGPTSEDVRVQESRPLPLTDRLQSVFASRIGDLPRPTRQLLLMAALDGTGELGVLGADNESTPDLSHLAPAEHLRLVRVDTTGRLQFRHPLTQSAVVAMATSEERRDAHTTLARRRSDDPGRAAWHLAEAATGPDEHVAALLHGVARTNLVRGDTLGAIVGLTRAADLSPESPERTIRLSEAAYLGAVVLGELRDVPERLAPALPHDDHPPSALASALVRAYFVLNDDGDVDTAHRLLVGPIDGLADPTDAHDQTLREALYNLLSVCFFGGREELWAPFHRALARLRPRPPALLAVLGQTSADPARADHQTLDVLDHAVAALERETSAARTVRVAIASAYVDRLSGCRSALVRVARDGRDGGEITSAIEALFLLSYDAWFSGRWTDAWQSSDEGLALCDTHGYRLLQSMGTLVQGLLAAAQGQTTLALRLAHELTTLAAPRNARALLHYASHIQTMAALSAADFNSAFTHAAEISPAGTFLSHRPHALWLVLDVTEAGVRSGRTEAARAHANAARELGLDRISGRLALVTAGASALCQKGDAREEFEAALAVPGAEQWPFEFARIHLAYGGRLRRSRDTATARYHLRSALDIFQRLDATPWATRTANELRATGIPVDTTVDEAGVASLTPQQRRIALLAASGLTNKQIGERLYLSPRTVGTHLYQLFPKLGVTSRAALRDALTTGAVASDQLGGEERS